MRARSALLSTGARPLRRRHQASRVRWLCATPVRRARPPTTLSRLPSKLSTPARTTLLRGDPPARLPACRPLRTCRHHTIRIRVAASSVEMGAKKKPKKKPVKKQVRSVGLPLPPPSTEIHTHGVTKLSPPLCTTATPGAERRQRAVLPRGRQGLHRRPQRLRLQDRPLELEPIPCVRRVSYPLHDCAALAPYPAPLPLSLAHDHP